MESESEGSPDDVSAGEPVAVDRIDRFTDQLRVWFAPVLAFYGSERVRRVVKVVSALVLTLLLLYWVATFFGDVMLFEF